MEVPREMANNSLLPTGDPEVEPARPAMDVWKAAGRTIELSTRAQHRPWNSELLRTYITAIDRSEICNCAARELQPYDAGSSNDSVTTVINIGTHLFMVFESADKETHS